jgi:anti-anti-sigma factor
VEVEEVLKPLFESNGKDVIIECKGLEYIASSGLRILLSILKGAKAAGSKVTLRNVNDDIKNVFKLTGFISIFEFE